MAVLSPKRHAADGPGEARDGPFAFAARRPSGNSRAGFLDKNYSKEPAG
jgi:hypothetical protein